MSWNFLDLLYVVTNVLLHGCYMVETYVQIGCNSSNTLQVLGEGL
jgi:hypothetical protein